MSNTAQARHRFIQVQIQDFLHSLSITPIFEFTLCDPETIFSQVVRELEIFKAFLESEDSDTVRYCLYQGRSYTHFEYRHYMIEKINVI